MGSSLKSAEFLMASRMRDARRGDGHALYDLGVIYSTGSGGIDVDLIEAHKWFNLAAVTGLGSAQAARAEIAEDMSASEIAQAQRQARAWLGVSRARAA